LKLFEAKISNNKKQITKKKGKKKTKKSIVGKSK